jgi:hypothetical protein
MGIWWVAYRREEPPDWYIPKRAKPRYAALGYVSANDVHWATARALSRWGRKVAVVRSLPSIQIDPHGYPLPTEPLPIEDSIRSQ